jgi:hypothetical protein
LADTEREAPRGVSWKDFLMPVRYPDEFAMSVVGRSIPGRRVISGQDFEDGYCLQFVASAYAAGGVNIESADTAADYR